MSESFYDRLKETLEEIESDGLYKRERVITSQQFSEIDVKAVISKCRDADAALVMLIGVQSNQFPRALDIARPLREAGLQVAIALLAADGAGQIGESREIEMLLPQREFGNPVARAVIEQRRDLASDPETRDRVAFALDAIADARAEGRKIVPLCPFVNAQRRRHPEWADQFSA